MHNKHTGVLGEMLAHGLQQLIDAGAQRGLGVVGVQRARFEISLHFLNVLVDPTLSGQQSMLVI